MARKIQPAFNAGEISPEIHGRVDSDAYARGLATARNTVVHAYGGISARQGTTFLAPVKDHTQPPRLIPFQFKTTDKYIIELGDQYARFIRNDGHVVEPAVTITGATQASPVVITTSGSHGYTTGDEVFISGVVGMTELNGNRYTITVLTGSTYSLQSQVTGNNINGLAFSAYASGGTSARIYTISTPYLQADLREINYIQNADVMTLVHQNYAPRELTRADHDDWTLSVIDPTPDVAAPTSTAITVNTTGAVTVRYAVTSIDRVTGEESLTGLSSTARTITNITQADPAVVTTSASHGYVDDDEVEIRSVVGMTEVNNNRYIIDVLSPTTFALYELDGDSLDSTGFTAYSSGGSSFTAFARVTNSAVAYDNTITWVDAANAGRYVVYREENGLFAFIGETEALTFDDDDITADLTKTPPSNFNPFDDADEYPAAVGYFEQRRVFGGSIAEPDTSHFSQTGAESNFSSSIPVQADDAITATLSAREVNEIRHYVVLGDLLTFTSGSEWRITSGSNEPLTPSSIRQRPQSYWGSSFRPPIVIGNTVFYVTEDQSNVRNLNYSFELDAFTGENVNLVSRHLLEEHTILDWSYSRIPDSRIYLVRSDGELLTFTYEREQQVAAWTHWDTDGKFESTATLRGAGSNSEDSVYFVVRRTINGNTVRYIEVHRQKVLSDVRDVFHVDCGLTLDNPLAIENIAFSGGSTPTITITGHPFSDGDTIDIFDIEWEPNVDTLFNETQPAQLNTMRFVVTNSAANSFDLETEGGDPVDTTGWNAYVEGGTVRLAVLTLSGLDHLEGETVKILADGNVISDLTVSSGSLTLPRRFSRVHVGLPYIADIELLSMTFPDPVIEGQSKKVAKVILRFFKSRGLLVGYDSSDLAEMKQRTDEALGDPTRLLTGDKEIIIPSTWEADGRVFMRQKDPLPLTLLFVVPQFESSEEY